MKIPRCQVIRAIEACLLEGARSATVYLDSKTTIKATRMFKVGKRNRQTMLMLTIGTPNYLERKFIKLCKRAGEPFPVRKMQLKFYPNKKQGG